MKKIFILLLAVCLVLVSVPDLKVYAADADSIYFNDIFSGLTDISQFFSDSDYETNIQNAIDNGADEGILLNCKDDFFNSSSDDSFTTSFYTFLTDPQNANNGFCTVSRNDLTLNIGKSFAQNMYPALYDYIVNPSSYKTFLYITRYSTANVGFYLFLVPSNFTGDLSFVSTDGGYIMSSDFTGACTQLIFTLPYNSNTLIFNNSIADQIAPDDPVALNAIVPNSLYECMYSDLNVYFTYLDKGYTMPVDVPTQNYDTFPHIYNTLLSGVDYSSYIFDRRQYLSSYLPDDGGEVFPDGSGGTYANNMFLQKPDFVFDHKNYYPPYNIMIDSGSIFPEGYVTFKALLNDYQIENVANFDLVFSYSLLLDIDYQNQGQNEFLWFKKTSSITNNYKNLQVNFTMTDFYVHLSTFYNNNCSYSKPFEDLWNSLEYGGVSLMGCMRQMKELTSVKYNSCKLYCSVYLSSQGVKSGSYKEYYNPITRKGLITDTSIQDNTNPFILPPDQQNEVKPKYEVPVTDDDSGGTSSTSGGVSVVNNDNDNINIKSNWQYFLEKNPDDVNPDDEVSAIDQFKSAYDIVTRPETNPLNSDFLKFLFSSDIWEIYPFNLIMSCAGMLITVGIFTAILRLFRR